MYWTKCVCFKWELSEVTLLEEKKSAKNDNFLCQGRFFCWIFFLPTNIIAEIFLQTITFSIFPT